MQAEASADMDPTRVQDALPDDAAPDLSDRVEGGDATTASDLVCEASNLDCTDYDRLWSNVGGDDIASVTASMDTADLAAASTPEARDIAEDLPEDAEKKVSDAVT